MKVSELSGALLDYWVLRTAGYDDVQCRADARWFHPSSDWAHGGPIIERERIIIGVMQRMGNGRWTHLHWTGRTFAPANYNEYKAGIAGDTALIAAMRAYVESKFGEEVSDEVTL